MPAARVLGFYHRLPEELRRCLRPLNFVDELASFLSPRVAARTTTGTEMLRRLARLPSLHYGLHRLEGPERQAGAPLVCVLAADDAATRWWARTLFAGDPDDERLGVVRASAAAAATAALASAADMTICQLPWPLMRLAPRPALVPSSVPFWLDTSQPFDAIVHGERRGRASRKDDARRVRRLSLRVRIARGRRAVERFRQELYEPYARRRFGDLFMRIPPHAFRQAERHGWLLLLDDGGRTVAGALLERWGRERRILAFGVELDGAIPSGLLLEACYYHVIRFAAEAGIARLSLGTVRPVLTDGVLRYKRKWGASLGRPSTWEAFSVSYRSSPSVRAAFSAAPLVIDRGPDGLAAIVGSTGIPVSEALERVDTPGLRQIAVLVDETPGVDAAADPRLRIVPPGEVWPPAAAIPTVPTAPAPPVPAVFAMSGRRA